MSCGACDRSARVLHEEVVPELARMNDQIIALKKQIADLYDRIEENNIRGVM